MGPVLIKRFSSYTYIYSLVAIHLVPLGLVCVNRVGATAHTKVIKVSLKFTDTLDLLKQ